PSAARSPSQPSTASLPTTIKARSMQSRISSLSAIAASASSARRPGIPRTDFTAIGALRAAYTLHLRIPQDVAIAGFDNIPIAAYQTPPLTTVEQPIVEQGRIGAELLLKRIEA